MNNQIKSVPSKGFTHGGVFHADDVFSSALLKILNPAIEIQRGFKVPEDFDGIVFDIGFGEFDHHQKDVAVRENGIKYASFGLLWKQFGSQLVSDEQVEDFDKKFVQAIDDMDNGGANNPMSIAIGTMASNWYEPKENMEKHFWSAVDFAKTILQAQISKYNSITEANNIVNDALNSSDGQVVLMDQYVPWQTVLSSSTAKFVITPSLRGGFQAQAVPPVGNPTGQKIPFPKEWIDELPDGVTFCHTNLFLISTETQERAFELCSELCK